MLLAKHLRNTYYNTRRGADTGVRIVIYCLVGVRSRWWFREPHAFPLEKRFHSLWDTGFCDACMYAYTYSSYLWWGSPGGETTNIILLCVGGEKTGRVRLVIFRTLPTFVLVIIRAHSLTKKVMTVRPLFASEGSIEIGSYAHPCISSWEPDGLTEQRQFSIGHRTAIGTLLLYTFRCNQRLGPTVDWIWLPLTVKHFPRAIHLLLWTCGNLLKLTRIAKRKNNTSISTSICFSESNGIQFERK